ncbi:MAG: hypothetical protein GXO77_03390, partial [Calditrichaeota bacterium]|nr:hypothetical protein [Calditrichota bacterium]
NGRKLSGSKLDSNPVTIAVVDKAFPHKWIYDPSSHKGYEPGADTNHKLWIFTPDKYEVNDDSTSATLLVINSGKTNKPDTLSLHNSNDIDFFTLQIPIDASCKNAARKYPAYYNVTPSYLQICAEPMFPLDSLRVTVFTGNNQKQIFDVGKCVQNPLLAGSVSFINVENIFPSGKVKFSVEAKTDKSGKKERGSYSLTIKYEKCKIEKQPFPASLKKQ